MRTELALEVAPERATVRVLAHTTAWGIVVDAFLNSGVDADSTRRVYRRHLLRLFGQLGVETVAELNGALLAAYRASVVSSPLAPLSQGQALAAVRSFMNWARSMGAHGLSRDVLEVALRMPKATVRRPYQVLSEPEVAAILAAAAAVPRDLALLAVMLGGGLRVSEVSHLDCTDLVVDDGGEAALYVRQGKGRKDRIVPVQPEVARVIRAYLAATKRILGSPGPLFRAFDRAAKKKARGRLTSRSIASVVSKYVEAAAIHAKQISPHALRHTYAIRALRAGSNIIAVSKLMGHSNLQTTMRYLEHLELGELRAAVPPLPLEL